MPKYKSLFNVEGSLGEVTFYKSQDGYYLKTKSGVSKNRIMNDPSFARTRENLEEFKNVAGAGKILRRAITSLMTDAKDNRVTSRLTKVLSKVKNEDLTSARGQRTVAIGIATTAGKAWLRGFNFNKNALLDSILKAGFTLTIQTGEIVIANINVKDQLTAPEGATNVSFSSGFLNLDFTTALSDLQLSNVENITIDNTERTITLTPAAAPTGDGQAYYFLKIEFYQEINGVQYALNNGAFNALQLIQIV
ncbi:hypothetical protein ACG2LH_13685 [Zhouia sp. PK063]|uniref:hypothetical protein n=1 Tax=Zhouia sp. PK063 TaxID=3373602 RepID=UPI0037984F65